MSIGNISNSNLHLHLNYLFMWAPDRVVPIHLHFPGGQPVLCEDFAGNDDGFRRLPDHDGHLCHYNHWNVCGDISHPNEVWYS